MFTNPSQSLRYLFLLNLIKNILVEQGAILNQKSGEPITLIISALNLFNFDDLVDCIPFWIKQIKFAR